jgi:hypothetical protein
LALEDSKAAVSAAFQFKDFQGERMGQQRAGGSLFVTNPFSGRAGFACTALDLAVAWSVGSLLLVREV